MTTNPFQPPPTTKPYQIAQQIRSEASNYAAADRARRDAVERCTELARKAYAVLDSKGRHEFPEKHLAEDFGVNRRTMRRWLGKDD